MTSSMSISTYWFIQSNKYNQTEGFGFKREGMGLGFDASAGSKCAEWLVIAFQK